METTMPASPYQHITTAQLADMVLGLAQIAPHGSVKGELAFTAALLTGRGSPAGGNDHLLQSVRDLRDTLASRFLKGDDAVTAEAISHMDEALRLLSDLPALPALQVQPVSEE
jgi:hypothetical protein